jgi:hypothetical protein
MCHFCEGILYKEQILCTEFSGRCGLSAFHVTDATARDVSVCLWLYFTCACSFLIISISLFPVCLSLAGSEALKALRPYAARTFSTLTQETNERFQHDSASPNSCSRFSLVHSFSFRYSPHSNSYFTSSSSEQTCCSCKFRCVFPKHCVH